VSVGATTAVAAAERDEERRTAMRALLAEPFVGADSPEYRLVRRHEHDLRRTAFDAFGYQLEVTSSTARLLGPPTPAGLHRPLRVRPASATGRARPRDEWPTLSDRACVLLFLTLAALERGRAQIAIADLAREVERAGADVESPIDVDFRERSERVAFADGLDLLCAWGLLEHTAGSRESFARRTQGEDEALLTVDRRRVAIVIADPARAMAATTVAELVDDAGAYAPTPEGERRRRFHRLARRLVEDPALVLDDLGEEDRQYFLGQRARVEDAVADATGMAIERRAEGTAVVADDRQLTDVPFPTSSTIKQLALLLCDRLASGEPLSEAELRSEVRALLAAHRAHWGRDPRDPEQVRSCATAALAVLEALDLVRVGPAGSVQPQPLAARFRAPDVRPAGERLA
jgi:uncharacterized protein (TIGR02678 family)